MTDKDKKIDESPKKTDEEILFSEETIEGITIKPWSFGILFDIIEDLEAILIKMEDAGLDIDDLLVNGVTWKSMVKLFTIASPHILRIIHLTAGVDEEVVRNLPLEVGVKIGLLIYSQNRDQIKNALGPTQEK